MIKGNEMLGKPIIAYNDGSQVETIQDIVFDAKQSKVLAFLVDEGGLLSSARIVPFSSIKSIGPDAVTVNSAQVVIPAEQDEKVRQILNVHRTVKGLTVMTEDGQDLGEIKDLCFDPQSGQIVGYEVSGGLFADAYSGRSFLPAPQALKLGKDVAFVPNETVQLMEQQVGGIKAASQQAATQARRQGEALTQKAKESYGQASQRVKEEVSKRTEGKGIGGKAREFSQQARREWQERSPGVMGELGQVWDQLKGSAMDLRDQTAQRVEEERIRGALGRPVTRVIFDQQDRVIIDTGELITHEAIERSRQAGVLDMLLSSVYTEKPKLDPKDLRARSR